MDITLDNIDIASDQHFEQGERGPTIRLPGGVGVEDHGSGDLAMRSLYSYRYYSRHRH